MSWQYDPSPPHRTPEQVLNHYCLSRGISRSEAALPPVLLASFQGAAYHRLLAATGASSPTERVDGTALMRDVAVGTLRGSAVGVVRLNVGAPATALTLELAIARGARDVLVVGSAGSLQASLPIGSVVVITGAEREDGTSHHYLPPGELVRADKPLTELLVASAYQVGLRPVLGRSWTIDAPYRETEAGILRHRQAGVAVVEMEAAAIFAVTRCRGVRAGLIVAVSDELFGPWNSGFHLQPFLDALAGAADAVLHAGQHLNQVGSA